MPYRTGKSIETEDNLVASRGWGQEGRVWLLKNYEVSPRDDENILKL